MEKIDDKSQIFSKFGVLWELLPFYGYLQNWVYLMIHLNICTHKFWIKHQSEFKELAKRMKMRIMKYEYVVDDKFLEYISKPEVISNYKFWINMRSSLISLGTVEKFKDFLEEWYNNKISPIFHKFDLPIGPSVSHFFEPIYKILKEMGAKQEDILVSDWSISSSESKYDPLSKK